MPTIKVSVVEDDSEVRQTLTAFLNRSSGFRCISHYAYPAEALRELPHDNPDVVLMDIKMPGMTGIECVSRLMAAAPKIKVIMLTVYEENDTVYESLAAGALGYVVKSQPLSKVLEAIREVYEGGSPMSAHIARKVVEHFQKRPVSAPESQALAPRERLLLAHLAEGKTYEQISDEMGISVSTVRTYIVRIYEKLQVHSRTEAVARFVQDQSRSKSSR